MKNHTKKHLMALLLAAAMLTAVMSGCGEGAESHAAASVPVQAPVQDTDTPAAGGPAQDTEKPAAASMAESNSTGNADVGQADTEPEPEEPDMDSIEGIARLGSLVGSYSPDSPAHWDCLVDCEDSHNPYDLVWHYGDPDTKFARTRSRSVDKWGSLYQGYVDACDWSLVFDAEYYKKAFPVLATLYHNDDALLLEHFQTRGVHEGRQACAEFNVSAYMENCGSAVRNAFGDNYECYYFYYMLHYDAEHLAETRNTGGKYPLWLTVELTKLQYDELSMNNSLRKDVDVEPIIIDPELTALACYRAWNDAVNHIEGHDWLDTNRRDAYDLIDMLGLDYGFSENTHKNYCTSSPMTGGFWAKYKNSKPHYEAMVDPVNTHIGVSNCYIQSLHDGDEECGDNVMYAQFEIYAHEQPHTPNKLD